MQRDPRVDDYIAGAQEFARPILHHLRKAVHDAAPDVEETIKWSRPFFLVNGRILCNMSAFKKHCSFGIWNGEVTAAVKASGVEQDGMGSFGRIASLAGLPEADQLRAYVQQAAAPLREGRAVNAGRRNTGVKPRSV